MVIALMEVLPSLLSVFAGIICGIVYKYIINHREHSLYRSKLALAVLVICIGMVGIILSGIQALLPTPSEDDISTRITRITNSLTEIASEISSIQGELETRIETVEALKKEAEIAQDVISLTDEQVNAIQSKLNQELESSSLKNTIITILVSAFFFVLGLALPAITTFFKGKQDKPASNVSVLSDEQLNQMIDQIAEKTKERLKEDTGIRGE